MEHLELLTVPPEVVYALVESKLLHATSKANKLRDRQPKRRPVHHVLRPWGSAHCSSYLVQYLDIIYERLAPC